MLKINAGFSLIEIMAATLILALVCVAYSQNQVGAIQLIKATRFRNTAILLASEKMAELNFIIMDKGIEQIRDEEKGEFDQEKFEGFSWRATKQKVPAPDFSSLMAVAGGGEAPPSQKGGFDGPMKMVTDIWGKSIMELRLEITWKEGEQEKSYSLMTHYMVSNVNAQIQGLVGALTGGGGGKK